MAASPLGRLVARLGPEMEDADEETFLLLAHDRPPAQNLGFVDAQAAAVDLAVAGRDLTIHQSPAVLHSRRAGGTTGAVVWKISPAVAAWLARPDNLFFRAADGSAGLLGPGAAVLELGCGIAGVVGLALAGRASDRAAAKGPARANKKGHRGRAAAAAGAGAGAAYNTVARYVLTDQAYVSRLLQRNLEENGVAGAAGAAGAAGTSLYFRPLDWETDAVTPALLRGPEAGHDHDHDRYTSFDAVLACDCIYNEALIAPLVQTCADACRLRQSEADDKRADGPPPTLCIVAQQLRDPDVLAAWLAAFHAAFRVWRVPADLLTPDLRPAAGFAVHVGILREAAV